MKINLLPPPPPLIRVRVQVLLALMTALILSCIFLGAAYYTTVVELSSAKAQVTASTYALQATQRRSVIVAQQVAAQTLNQQILSIMHASVQPAELIGSVQTDVAPYGTLDMISVTPTVVSLTASLHSYLAAGEFIRALDHNPMLTNVVVPSVTGGSGTLTAPGSNPVSSAPNASQSTAISSALSAGQALLGALLNDGAKVSSSGSTARGATVTVSNVGSSGEVQLVCTAVPVVSSGIATAGNGGQR